MRTIWTDLNIEAPSEIVWTIFTDPTYWSSWGPSVRRARLDTERLQLGATGTVTTVVGAEVGFEITRYEEGARWAWKVAGVDATDHRVEPISSTTCRAGFGVPWVTTPYLLVCKVALHRIKTLAENHQGGPA